MKAFSSALVLLLALVAISPADAQECTTIKQNTFTSIGCPKACGSYSCVLYAPTLAADKPCTNITGSVAGPCQTLAGFTAPNSINTCTLSFQCMEGIVRGTEWLLALEVIKNTDKVSMAYVTEINSITYDTTTVIKGVQLAGGATWEIKKGDVKNIVLDQSFFNTPLNATSLTLRHLNLQNALSSLNISANIENLFLMNTNLKEVPAQVASLNLARLDMSRNYITTLSSKSNDLLLANMKKLTNLNVAENLLTNIPSQLAALPLLDTLNLTGNPLRAIPEAIFGMKALKKLYMKDCNLTNIQLTDAQFTFLDQLTTFDAAITVTECAKGFAARTLQGTSVCFASASTAGGSNTTAIVIGVVGGVLVLCVIAFLVLRHRRKRGIMDPSDKVTYSMYDGMTDGTNGVSNGSDTLGSSIWNDPDLLAVRIDHRDVEPIKLLARGGFGEVWLGLYMNENVAIKRLLSDKKSMNDALQFATEIRLMARLDHPKIVRFIGVSWSNALTIQAITEFMDCGDLKSLLDSNRSSSLTWANLKCQIAIDIADALVYLHTLSPKMIHRDLKSRNVLIDAQTGAKLSDFGISRDRSVEETMTAGVGTARWIAPEVVLGGHYTEAADIYSYGVVLSELDTCKAPFHDAQNTNGAKMQDVTILQLVSAGKLQPSFTDHCLPSILKLARSCLEFDPTRRPTAMQIMYELRNILKNELK